MLWAGSLVLATVTSALAAPATPLASTYDEAACSAAAGAADPKPAAALLPLINDAGEAATSCSEPPAPAPALIDCNDPGASFWVAEMIGSCDMPKPAPIGLTQPALHAAHDAGVGRMCDGFRCSHDSSPLRAAARPLSDGSLVTLGHLELHVWLVATPLPPARELTPPDAPLPALERPPRAA